VNGKLVALPLAIVGLFPGGGGANEAGAAYVFERDSTGVWVEVQKLLASDATAEDQAGTSVAISDDRVIVGAVGDDTSGGHAGAAYLYERDAVGIWSEVQKLLASDGEAGDNFGVSVTISGNRAIVGARGDDAGGAWNARADMVDPAADVVAMNDGFFLRADGALWELETEHFGEPYWRPVSPGMLPVPASEILFWSAHHIYTRSGDAWCWGQDPDFVHRWRNVGSIPPPDAISVEPKAITDVKDQYREE
jgi:hypothetical protein